MKKDIKYKVMIGSGSLRYWLLDPNNNVVATFKTKKQAENSEAAMNDKKNVWTNPELIWKES